VSTQNYGFLFGDLRYEKEILKLCNEKGMEFKFDHIGCVIYEGQTQGCYGIFMDKIIMDKYGYNFKDSLHNVADSLFSLRVSRENLIVEYWDCDERARLPNNKKRSNDYLPGIKITSLDLRKEEGKYKA